MIKINYPQSNEILFLRGDINYTEFHLVDGKKVVSSTTLLRHQERLDGFLRVSRKHLVNLNYVDDIKTVKGKRYLLMQNKEEILVARRRNSHLLEKYPQGRSFLKSQKVMEQLVNSIV
jgi:DNA-binding LytR/AlgR family response regulator